MVPVFINGKYLYFECINEIKYYIGSEDIVLISQGKILRDYDSLRSDMTVEYFVRGRGGLPVSDGPLLAETVANAAIFTATSQAETQEDVAVSEANTQELIASNTANDQQQIAVKEADDTRNVFQRTADAIKNLFNRDSNTEKTNATLTTTSDQQVIAGKENTQAINVNQQELNDKDILDRDKNESLNRGQKNKEDVDTAMTRRQKIVMGLKGILTYEKFFPIIVLVLIILAFFGKPLEYIMLGLALVIIGIVYVMYCILSCDAFLWIPMIFWFTYQMIIPFFLYCCVFGALLLFVLVICLILAAINGITANGLKRLIMCQNNPANWYLIPNYQLGNKWERGIMCSRPCYSGYYPDTTGLFCKRLPKGNPPYCPYAETMRIYSGTSRTDKKYKFFDFNPMHHLNYITKSPAAREEMLKSYYMNKKTFNETCQDQLADYRNISLGICSATDILNADANNPLTKSMTAKQQQQLNEVCKQAFCNADKSYPFCANLGNSNTSDKSAIIIMVIKIAIYIIMFMIFIVLVIDQIDFKVRF